MCLVNVERFKEPPWEFFPLHINQLKVSEWRHSLHGRSKTYSLTFRHTQVLVMHDMETRMNSTPYIIDGRVEFLSYCF